MKKTHATVNISGQSMEDILLALDQVHEKVTGGYLYGSDRNESGSYLFEIYEDDLLV
ncbi:hypothetical protein RB298_05010 [Priestia sp. BR_2]